jgi:hypothetical protein
MPWIERRDNWLPRSAPMRRRDDVYTVSEVATLLKVSRNTVYKWLGFDEAEEAVIPPAMWFKLPTGHIRIRKDAIQALLHEQT